MPATATQSLVWKELQTLKEYPFEKSYFQVKGSMNLDFLRYHKIKFIDKKIMFPN